MDNSFKSSSEEENNNRIKRYEDRVVYPREKFRLRNEDVRFFGLIKKICIGLRKKYENIIDLVGSDQSAIFVLMCGGWVRDIVYNY